MGLSSSQARLLTLTSRMHDIEYKAAKLEAQKLQMANESRRVYDDYLNALDSTKIQYQTLGTDGSAHYNDGSYYDLCMGNSNVQFGLFNPSSGKVYIPSTFISAYNSAGGSADAFATSLTGYIPPNPNPSAPPTPTAPTWTPNPTTPTNPNITNFTNDTNITLSRGQSKGTTINAGNDITLTLTNPFGASNYTYTIGCSNASSSNVNFQFLENGRLVIEGNNLEINSTGTQNDDIILLGSDNELYTGGGNDVVRVGYTLDSSSDLCKQSDDNYIELDNGNDHIILFGCNNRIYGENGNDTALVIASNGGEIDFESIHNMYTNTVTASNKVDGKDGWTNQGNVGDCRLLALINSISKNTNTGSMNSYVTITPDNAANPTQYTVTFPNYSGSNKTTTVQKSTILNYQGVFGDLDTVITDIALNQLLAINKDDGKTSVENAYYNALSDYFYGNRNFHFESVDSTSMNRLWQDYQNNTINNLTVCFKSSNTRLGIHDGHAYSVKNITAEYIEVVNPWDDADSVKLDLSTFYNYAQYAFVYGSNVAGYNDTGIVTNGSSSSLGNLTDETDENEYMSINLSGGGFEINIPTLTIPTEGNNSNPINLPYIGSTDEPAAAAKHQALVNLFYAIQECGYEEMPENMMKSSEYLVNVINGGFGYLKMFDNKTNKWVDTSVAINTSLQEVNDESNLRKAEAKYEADMRKIDAKDRKYDIELAAFDNERNAIKSEMETLKTVAKDNVERTFKLFS